MQEPPSIRRVLSTLLGRPDEVMLELGAGGELLVAKVRALLSLLVLALPLVVGLLGPANTNEVLIGLGAGVFVNVMAQVWLALARNPQHKLPPHWWDGEADPALPAIDLIAPGRRADAPLRYALSQSFAFGGSNAALVFGAA